MSRHHVTARLPNGVKIAGPASQVVSSTWLPPGAVLSSGPVSLEDAVASLVNELLRPMRPLPPLVVSHATYLRLCEAFGETPTQ